MSSVVDVTGFVVLRASVGCVHPGAANGTMTKVGPSNFDYVLYFFYRSWSSFRGL